jgi:methylase of polypeptide subunit release factors
MRRLSLNCVRRHLSAEQKREIVRATLRATPDLSNNYLGELTGVDGKTVARVREELESTSEVPKLTAFRGKDGKTRPRHVYVRSARETVAVSEALQQLGDEAPDKLLTAREVIRKAKRVEAAAERVSAQPTEVVPPDALVEIHHCDFRQMPVAPGGARLIFTDPLYHREHLPLYSELAAWAAKVLQPGGLLVTHLGTSYLPEVVQMLGQHLEYVWQFATVFDGQKTNIHDRHIRSGWKPLLVYSNGPFQPAGWTVDVITARKEKERFCYQQPELEAEVMIRRFTKEGELCLDAFCGSGTTASVCKRLKRKCVTTDIDANAVAEARRRVANTKVGDPLGRPRIMTAPMPMEDDDIEFESSLRLPA